MLTWQYGYIRLSKITCKRCQNDLNFWCVIKSASGCPCMEDYKSLHVAVMVYATMVDSDTAFVQLYC